MHAKDNSEIHQSVKPRAVVTILPRSLGNACVPVERLLPERCRKIDMQRRVVIRYPRAYLVTVFLTGTNPIWINRVYRLKFHSRSNIISKNFCFPIETFEKKNVIGRGKEGKTWIQSVESDIVRSIWDLFDVNVGSCQRVRPTAEYTSNRSCGRLWWTRRVDLLTCSSLHVYDCVGLDWILPPVTLCSSIDHNLTSTVLAIRDCI